MKLEILVGMIASGKSTYARKRADEGALVVCHDDLTAMLHARYRYEQGLRECYRRMEEALAFQGLSAGRNLVIDRTHLTRESRRRWILWAHLYVNLNTFDDREPEVEVIAVTFPMRSPANHANIRWQSDPRGRSFEEWHQVALHHAEQAMAEPLELSEGFDRTEEAPCG